MSNQISCATLRNKFFLLYYWLVVLIPLLVKIQETCQYCWCIPQCSQISKGTGCLFTCLNDALQGSPVQCQTAGADVDTTRTAVFTKSWKPVLKSCHASRCTIRCFWDWSPHHACCWPEFLSWGQHWLSKESEDSLLRWVWGAFYLPNCWLYTGSRSNCGKAQGLVGLRMPRDTQILACASPKQLFTNRFNTDS